MRRATARLSDRLWIDYLGLLAGGRLMVSAAEGTGEAGGRRLLKRAPSSVKPWGVKKKADFSVGF